MSTWKPQAHAALLRFIEENQKSMYRLAYSYVKNPDTALDMVQESIYKALKAHESMRDAAHVKSWIFRILVNTCLDELRRSRRLVETAPEDFPEQADDSLAGAADSLALRDALETLDAKTKTVIVLRYFEGLKISEISDVLQEAPSCIKSRLYRGLRTLKLEIGEAEV